MAKKRDRAFAAFGAALFLITSSALTIAIAVQALDSRNKKDDPAVKAQELAAQQAANDTNKEETVDPTNQLAGKPLADFAAVSSITKLETQDTTPGNGDEVKPGDTVTVDYTGAVAATGIVFQSSKDSGQPATFGLDQVIKGWTEGIPGMKVGGTRRVLIPADMAYGANPPSGSGIPANADLVFDVTLHKIGK